MVGRSPSIRGVVLGKEATGYRCPQCGAFDGLHFARVPNSGLHVADVLVFGILGALSAASDRSSWIQCSSCNRLFRRRTPIVVWSMLWCSLLLAGAVVALALPIRTGPPALSDEVADTAAMCAAFIDANPLAAAMCAAWIIAWVGLTLLVLVTRVWRLRRRVHALERAADARDRSERPGTDARPGLRAGGGDHAQPRRRVTTPRGLSAGPA
ncbi:MAG: hypothetical protein ACYTGR_02595 [Planctomycetota bacterium]|jgi:hypothetical protein